MQQTHGTDELFTHDFGITKQTLSLACANGARVCILIGGSPVMLYDGGAPYPVYVQCRGCAELNVRGVGGQAAQLRE